MLSDAVRAWVLQTWPGWLQAGGLSGEPLREEANAALKEMYRLTKGQLPIIGCGGIATGRHAYERIRAGRFGHAALYALDGIQLFLF